MLHRVIEAIVWLEAVVSCVLKGVLAFVCMSLTTITLTQLDCNVEVGLICPHGWLEYFTQPLLLKATLLFTLAAVVSGLHIVWRLTWWATLLWSALVGSAFYISNLSVWSLEARGSGGWLLIVGALLFSMTSGCLLSRWTLLKKRPRID